VGVLLYQERIKFALIYTYRRTSTVKSRSRNLQASLSIMLSTSMNRDRGQCCNMTEKQTWEGRKNENCGRGPLKMAADRRGKKLLCWIQPICFYDNWRAEEGQEAGGARGGHEIFSDMRSRHHTFQKWANGKTKLFVSSYCGASHQFRKLGR
jgi:hypothetical protein